MKMYLGDQEIDHIPPELVLRALIHTYEVKYNCKIKAHLVPKDSPEGQKILAERLRNSQLSKYEESSTNS